MAIKSITAKFAGKCHYCTSQFPAGTTVAWDSVTKAVYHPVCAQSMGIMGPVVAGPGAGVPLMTGKAATVAYVPPVVAAAIAKQAKLAKAIPVPAPAKVAPVAPVPVSGPFTQKARGIVALQNHKMLAGSFAKIATTLDGAITAAQAQGFPCFVRPCPITPRHGFVDSRVVQDVAGVAQVWTETIAADPKGELIVMPYVDADFNMVWRPGLLAIGPGHDGATAGHDSLSIFLQPAWSHSGIWQAVCGDAGVNLEKDDPFLEAVTAGGVDTVVTQIRAGVKGTVTAPDWNPAPFQIGEVVTLDGTGKADPAAMLAWETRAKELIGGFHVVHNIGGNLGDHWSVHAQLHGVAVVTSFVPKVGDLLPKLGVDLVDLDPQAILWGFLGGLAGPSLKTDLGSRKRAVCAAVCGVHHGLRMGGDAGVHIGASVAFLLRLAQAAVWGEARHAEHSGLSRDHVYKAVLDDWLTGREKFAEKVTLMHTHHWGGGFGGKPWAAIGHGTIALDASMLALLADPSVARAKDVLAKLNALVNLAHNNGWFLNKFCEAQWFDLAADLDPRAALMAGPAWYQAAGVPADARMALLSRIEKLAPITVSFAAPAGKSTTAKGPSKHVSMGSGTGAGAHVSSHTASKKIGGFGTVLYGEPVTAAGLAGAQAKTTGDDSIHMQIIVNAAGGYVSGEVNNVPAGVMAEIMDGPDVESAGGSGVKYFKLMIDPETGTVKAGDAVLVSVLKGGK